MSIYQKGSNIQKVIEFESFEYISNVYYYTCVCILLAVRLDKLHKHSELEFYLDTRIGSFTILQYKYA